MNLVVSANLEINLRISPLFFKYSLCFRERFMTLTEKGSSQQHSAVVKRRGLASDSLSFSPGAFAGFLPSVKWA